MVGVHCFVREWTTRLLSLEHSSHFIKSSSAEDLRNEISSDLMKWLLDNRFSYDVILRCQKRWPTFKGLCTGSGDFRALVRK